MKCNNASFKNAQLLYIIKLNKCTTYIQVYTIPEHSIISELLIKKTLSCIVYCLL